MISYKDLVKDYTSGYISGMVAIFVSHPIDTIKTNYQEKLPIKFDIKSLYKGIIPPLIGIGIEKSLVFGTYNTLYRYTDSHCISGGISGFTASFVVTPYERLKILYQTDTNYKLSVKNVSIGYLFSGLSATFYREVPGFAIYFSVYNFLKDKTKLYYSRDINMLESFIYGGFSGAFSWLFIYPQDRIKTHIQSSNVPISLKDGIKDILNDGGIRGLYRGFQFAIMRAVPLHATAFMVNELCNKHLFKLF
jgi:hypothetical protein